MGGEQPEEISNERIFQGADRKSRDGVGIIVPSLQAAPLMPNKGWWGLFLSRPSVIQVVS